MMLIIVLRRVFYFLLCHLLVLHCVCIVPFVLCTSFLVVAHCCSYCRNRLFPFPYLSQGSEACASNISCRFAIGMVCEVRPKLRTQVLVALGQARDGGISPLTVGLPFPLPFSSFSQSQHRLVAFHGPLIADTSPPPDACPPAGRAGVRRVLLCALRRRLPGCALTMGPSGCKTRKTRKTRSPEPKQSRTRTPKPRESLNPQVP